MDNQERNREALIEHIDELQRIIRRRIEQIDAQVEIIEEVRRDLADCKAMHAQQIENQAHNAREDQRAIDEQAALIDTLRAENPRPLTADDITDEMVERGAERFRGLPTALSAHARVRTIIRAALTPPPSRPEGAEELQALIRQAEAEGEGADNEALANYLAARLIDPTVKEQS